MPLPDPLRGLVELCWPARCAACDAFIPEDSVFCVACDLTVYELGGDTCRGCALPAAVGDDGASVAICRGCARNPAPYARAEAAVLYGESVAKAVVRMKHGGHRHLGGRLAQLLRPALLRALDAGDGAIDAIVPVPLHPRKLRRRGFNQALELALGAHRLAAADKGRMVPLPPVERATLVRVRSTDELGHAGPAARRREVAGAFAVARGLRVEGRTFLLVDDVMTTGATLGECARTLREAGAARVDVLVLARAP